VIFLCAIAKNDVENVEKKTAECGRKSRKKGLETLNESKENKMLTLFLSVSNPFLLERYRGFFVVNTAS
jgi:hypothetical protein